MIRLTTFVRSFSSVTMSSPAAGVFNQRNESSIVNSYLKFKNESPTQFHAVERSIDTLTKAGYKPLSEKVPLLNE